MARTSSTISAKLRKKKKPKTIQKPKKRVSFSTSLTSECFYCIVCPWKGSMKKQLRDHIQNFHDPARKFKCSSCDRRSPSQAALDNHVKLVHLKIYDFQCPHCPTKCFHSSDLTRHVAGVHKKCKDCGKQFASCQKVLEHYKAEHGKDKKPFVRRRKVLVERKIENEEAEEDVQGRGKKVFEQSNSNLTSRKIETDNQGESRKFFAKSNNSSASKRIKTKNDDADLNGKKPSSVKTNSNLRKRKIKNEDAEEKDDKENEQEGKKARKSSKSCRTIKTENVAAGEEAKKTSTESKFSSSKKHKKTVECILCGKFLKHQKALERHFGLYHEEKRKVMPRTPGINPDSDSEKVAKEAQTFNCEKCDKSFKKIGFLKFHIRKAHANTPPSPIKNTLESSFNDIASVESHTGSKPIISKAHEDTSQSPMKVTLESNLNDIPMAESHIASKAFISKAPQSPMKDALESPLKVSPSTENHIGSKANICDICGKCWEDRKALESHINKRHGKKSSCSDDLTDPKPLAKRLFKCDPCQLSFYSIDIFKQHRKAHELRSSKILDVDNKNQKEANEARSSNIDNKKQKSRKNIRYNCEYCDKSWTTPSFLRLHKKRAHNIYPNDDSAMSDKLFDCAECDQQFSTLSMLKVHYQTEHDALKSPIKKNIKEEKKEVFSCETCGKSFPDLDSLEQHAKLAHRMHNCTICSVGFDSEVILDQHIKEAHKDSKLDGEEIQQEDNIEQHTDGSDDKVDEALESQESITDQQSNGIDVQEETMPAEEMQQQDNSEQNTDKVYELESQELVTEQQCKSNRSRPKRKNVQQTSNKKVDETPDNQEISTEQQTKDIDDEEESGMSTRNQPKRKIPPIKKKEKKVKPVKVFQCYECDQIEPTREDLLTHINLLHKKLNKTSCPICFERFFYVDGHIILKHRKFSKPSTSGISKKMLAKVNAKAGGNIEIVRQEMSKVDLPFLDVQKAASNDVSDTVGNKAMETESPSQNEESQLQSNNSKKDLNKPLNLNDSDIGNLDEVMESSEHSVEDVNEANSSPYSLINRKQHACDLCPQKFNRKEHLDGHKSTVHSKKVGSNNYLCRKCDESFRSAWFLIQHRKERH